METNQDILKTLPDVKMGAVIGDYPPIEDFETTRNAIKEVFKEDALAMEPIMNGYSYRIFVFMLSDGRFWIVKKCKPGDHNDSFQKVRIITDSIRSKINIEIPQILHLYQDATSAYSFSPYIPGIPANVFAGDKTSIWYQLGTIAREINSISVPFFGSRFNEKQDDFLYYKSWKEYVESEISVCLDTRYTKHWYNIDQADLKKLETIISTYAKLEFDPKLINGDLWLKNVKVDSNGTVLGIVYWENVQSGFAPYAEFARSFEYRTTEEQKAFEKGYGLTLREHNNLKKYSRDILILEWFLKHLAFLTAKEQWGSVLHHEILLKELLRDYEKGLQHIWKLTSRILI